MARVGEGVVGAGVDEQTPGTVANWAFDQSAIAVGGAQDFQ